MFKRSEIVNETNISKKWNQLRLRSSTNANLSPKRAKLINNSSEKFNGHRLE